MPASSPSVYSMVCKEYPRLSAHLRYIRASISAQSWASTPPAPEFIVRIAAPSSYGPLKSLATSCSSRVLSTLPSSSATSRSISSSPSASSRSSSASETRERSPSSRRNRPSARADSADSARASSWSSQKSGRLISSLRGAASQSLHVEEFLQLRETPFELRDFLPELRH